MRTIDHYIDAAKREQGLKNDTDVGRALGIVQSNVSQWRTRRAWPSDAVMIRLATMAGYHPATALVELAMWKNRKHPEVVEVLRSISDAVKSSAAAVMIGALVAFPAPSDAGTKQGRIAVGSAKTIHYATNRCVNHTRLARRFPIPFRHD